jgi:hypothetical protein
MSYAQFCQVHEDALEWLLGVEDKFETQVAAQAAVAEVTRAQVKAHIDGNRDFMSEVQAQEKAIGQVGANQDL